MPTKASKAQKASDREVNRLAARLVAAITGEPAPKGEETRKLIGRAFGLLGAAEGGRARAAKLSDEKRKAIARKAARARWGKTRRNDRSVG